MRGKSRMNYLLTALIGTALIGCGCAKTAGRLMSVPQWQIVYSTNSDGSNYHRILDLHFVDSHRGWLNLDNYDDISDPAFLATTDGGSSWNEVIGVDIVNLGVANSMNIWATGYHKGIFCSSDSGKQWIMTSTTENLNSISPVSATEAWGISAEYAKRSVLRHTTDRGKTWTDISFAEDIFPGIYSMNAIDFTDALHGWALCSANIPSSTSNSKNADVMLRTNDGGKHWNAYLLPTLDHHGLDYPTDQVHFLNRIEGWAVRGGLSLLHTIDGGVSWSLVYPIGIASSQNSGFADVRAVSAQEVWAVGQQGVDPLVMHSLDGGKTWKKIETGAEHMNHMAAFTRITAVDPQHVWIAGEGGHYGGDLPPQSRCMMSFVLKYNPASTNATTAKH
jgi:photosystem II stability/assembly factor-like uncharacterized protein